MVEVLKGSDKIGLRKMTPEDIPYGMKLKSLAGWNQLEADWKMLLDTGGDNFVASLDGEDAGIAVSLPYQDHLTWIAMVLVDPNARRMGVGKTLMNKVIELAQPKGAIRLDATAEGYELYKRYLDGKNLKTAILSELKVLLPKLVLSYYLLIIKSGKCDKEKMQWVYDNLSLYEDKNIAPKIVREQVIKHVMNIKKRDLPYYSMDLFDDKGVSVGYIKYKYS